MQILSVMEKKNTVGAVAENDYVIRVLNTPLQVNADDWNALLALQSPGEAPSPFMRHEYLAAMHESGMRVRATFAAKSFSFIALLLSL